MNVTLSTRQKQVISLAAHGLTDKEIGRRLDISIDMVRRHLGLVRKKVQATNTTQAVAIVVKKNLIDFAVH